MKNIINILFAVLITGTMFSQTIKPVEQYFDFNTQDNIYFKDVNNTYDKFLGTWEYSNGPYYFKAVITKLIKYDSGYRAKTQYFDQINCDFVYKYNGVVVYNVMFPYEMVNGRKQIGFIRGLLIKDNNTLNIDYNEPSTTVCERIRRGDLTLTYLANGSTPQLKWDRTDSLLQDGIPAASQSCPSGAFDDSEYKIPANMVLNKI